MIVEEKILNQIRNYVGIAVRDYWDEARSHMEYWSKEDEAECRRQVCDEIIDLITSERNLR